MSPTLPVPTAASEAAVARSLENRHALVTGAGGGIGAAIARRLTAEGARVTLAVRRAAGGAGG